VAQPEPTLDVPIRTDAGRARRWWSILARATGLVLLCHAIPIAGAGYTWLLIEQRSTHQCVDCHAFDGLFLVLIVGTVAVSLAVGLLLAGILVLARLRRPLLIGLVSGATGLLLTAYTVLELMNWLLGLLVGG
jgi:hypothetical protein